MIVAGDRYMIRSQNANQIYWEQGVYPEWVGFSALRSLQATVTRSPYLGAADERVSLMDGLVAYTSGGAWAAHLEHLTGTLRAGMAADLVLIDGNIETIPAENLGQTGIALTICGGRVTHDPKRMAGEIN